MTKQTTPVVKAGWGSARHSFISRLPKILTLLRQGKTRKEIHLSLQLEMSYRQFCFWMSNQPTLPNHLPRTVDAARRPQKSVSSAHQPIFSIPSIDLDEGASP